MILHEGGGSRSPGVVPGALLWAKEAELEGGFEEFCLDEC